MDTPGSDEGELIPETYDRFIIPLMWKSEVPFLPSLGTELADRGYDVVYVPQNKPHIVNEVRDRLASKVVGRDHLSGQPSVALEKLLEKYNISSVRSFVFPQMVYDYAYTNVDHHPFLLSGTDRPDYEPYVDLLHRVLAYFDELFGAGDGGIPILHQGAEILRRALHRVADYHDVPSVWIGFSPVPGHCGLYDDEFVNWDSFDETYDVSMTDEEYQQASEYVTRIRENKPIVGSSDDEAGADYLGLLATTLRRVVRLASPDTDRRRVLEQFTRLKARRAGKRLKGRVADRIYMNQERSRQLIEEQNYVFFPLQYYRESRVTVRAAPYYDLVSLVEYLSRSLPHGYELVVKDHPRQMGALPLDSIRAIARHSNAIATDISAHDVVKQADAVVTLNNTVGYEALVHGKPVVTLGAAFYSGAGYTYDVSDIHELPDVLHEAVDSGGLSEQEVREFVHRLIDGSYPGNWNDTDPDNVSTLVDSILSYCQLE